MVCSSKQQCVKINLLFHRFHNGSGICWAFEAHSKDIGVPICLQHSAMFTLCTSMIAREMKIWLLILSSVSESNFANENNWRPLQACSHHSFGIRLWETQESKANFTLQYLNPAAGFRTRRAEWHVAKIRPDSGLRLPWQAPMFPSAKNAFLVLLMF